MTPLLIAFVAPWLLIAVFVKAEPKAMAKLCLVAAKMKSDVAGCAFSQRTFYIAGVQVTY